jgi:Glycine cleavage system T protein (aminomethyltransferase)
MADGGSPRHQVACLTLDDPDAVILSERPVLVNDEPVGYVHSAEYGYTVGSCIAYTYLPPEHAAPGTSVEILYEGQRYPATVREEPLA